MNRRKAFVLCIGIAMLICTPSIMEKSYPVLGLVTGIVGLVLIVFATGKRKAQPYD